MGTVAQIGRARNNALSEFLGGYFLMETQSYKDLYKNIDAFIEKFWTEEDSERIINKMDSDEEEGAKVKSSSTSKRTRKGIRLRH